MGGFNLSAENPTKRLRYGQKNPPQSRLRRVYLILLDPSDLIYRWAQAVVAVPAEALYPHNIQQTRASQRPKPLEQSISQSS
jgi:hypothetical protein